MDQLKQHTTTFTIHQGDEERCVSIGETPSGIVVSERSWGALTEATHDQPVYKQSILIKPLSIDAAAYVLGVTKERICEALTQFFVCAPYRMLCDLMDYFDLNDVPFDYYAVDKAGGAIRLA